MKTVKKRPIVGVGVIVVKEGKVLLGKRRGSHGVGSWQFPGGHLELNESVQECARREVWEEAGIEIRNIKPGPFTNDIFEQEDKHYVTLFVIAEYAGGSIQVKELEKCERWEWFEWESLPYPLFLPIQNLLKLGFEIT